VGYIHVVQNLIQRKAHHPSKYFLPFEPNYGISFLHYLTALGGLVAIPLILSKSLCLEHDTLTQSHLISTIFFVSGICTLLQVIFGVRLPILQGGTFAFLTPSLAMLSLPSWKCPAWTNNASMVDPTSPKFIDLWQVRMRELQGAIMVASCFQIFVGFSGLIGFLMRFIGPLTIAPTITLVALPLFILCSFNNQNNVLFALTITWLLCFVLTITNVLPSDTRAYGYLARTDSKGDVISKAPWFRFPYPGQWGVPTISLAGVFGIIAGVISSMVESVGDYYACARLSGAPPPPKHAINRGIGVEGIGCLLAGAWGTGNGTTSYSENVGALGITRVGSRMVIVAGGLVLLLTGMFGKIGAVFASIPTPIIGGMFLVMFSIITAVGVSNLQYTDMNSSRNIFIFGFSIFAGLTIPHWVQNNTDKLTTGTVQLDQVIQVLLTTGMFVGGFLGFFLDNTIPGSQEERGLLAWRKDYNEESDGAVNNLHIYDLPFGIGSKFCVAIWFKYLPICPKQMATRGAQEQKSNKADFERNSDNDINTKV
uniref:Solute carrier family 23 member 1 n=1 Tax=Pseudonaja textilis TaxID=8673 RepID=A0A670XPI0_PSETE